MTLKYKKGIQVRFILILAILLTGCVSVDELNYKEPPQNVPTAKISIEDITKKHFSKQDLTVLAIDANYKCKGTLKEAFSLKAKRLYDDNDRNPFLESYKPESLKIEAKPNFRLKYTTSIDFSFCGGVIDFDSIAGESYKLIVDTAVRKIPYSRPVFYCDAKLYRDDNGEYIQVSTNEKSVCNK